MANIWIPKKNDVFSNDKSLTNPKRKVMLFSNNKSLTNCLINWFCPYGWVSY